eukprot:3943026-Pleurochrysis_carterae.AAC.1
MPNHVFLKQVASNRPPLRPAFPRSKPGIVMLSPLACFYTTRMLRDPDVALARSRLSSLSCATSCSVTAARACAL